MKAYTKLYLEYFGYTTADFIGCEVCGKRANDIHHIFARGMGGSKSKDVIGNLMAVCRTCHIVYGDKTEHRDFLIEIHKKKLMDR